MQYACDDCKSKLFYVMLQDDGSVEVFCAPKNHKKTLVNITELVTHLLSQKEQSTNEDTRPDASEYDSISTDLSRQQQHGGNKANIG